MKAKKEEKAKIPRSLKYFKYIIGASIFILSVRLSYDFVMYFNGHAGHYQPLQKSAELLSFYFFVYLIFHYLEDIYKKISSDNG